MLERKEDVITDPTAGVPPFALLGTVAFILCLVLAVVWIILPFSIIGTKPILRELLAEQIKATVALEHLARSLEEHRKLLAALSKQPPAGLDYSKRCSNLRTFKHCLVLSDQGCTMNNF